MNSSDPLIAEPLGDRGSLVPEASPEATRCPSCGSNASGKFCTECGEAISRHRDLSIVHFLQHALHDLTHFDTRFFRTLKLLVRKPGALTLSAIEGDQRAVMKPFQLFLVLNLIFFLLNASFFKWHLEAYRFEPNGRITSKGEWIAQDIRQSRLSPEVYDERFESKLHSNQKAYLVLLIPAFALLLQLVYIGRHRYFVEHILTATHFVSFLLLFLVTSQVVIGVPLLIIVSIVELFGYRLPFTEVATETIVCVALMAYLWPALRRTYFDGRLVSFLRAAFLCVAVVPLVLLYRELLFWITAWSM